MLTQLPDELTRQAYACNPALFSLPTHMCSPRIPAHRPPPLLQVLAGHLRSSCGLCSGELRPTLPSAVFRKQLVVFRNIAGFHGFELLEQLADWLLGQHPGEVPGMAQAAAEV